MSQALALRMVKKAPPTSGVAVFALIRDEDYLLPFFFQHYRALGAETFLIYDDRSGPAAKAVLHAQPDCSILESDHVFGDTFGVGAYGAPRRLPAALKEGVPAWAYPTRWVLTVDADEFLVLPPGVGDLNRATQHLEAIGQPYLTAPMVDFYGETLNSRNHAADIGPFEASPYFDAGPYHEWAGGVTPSRLLKAGVMHRLMDMMRIREPVLLNTIYGGEPGAPLSWKTPLLKNGVGITRIGDHDISIAPSTAFSGALAHFKFTLALDAKIEHALAERQYFGGSMHYRFLDAAIRLFGDEALISAQTRRFTGPQSLEEAALMSGVGFTAD